MSFLGDSAVVLTLSSGEEPAPPRHRADAASTAWRSTRRFGTNAPRNFDFHTGAGCGVGNGVGSGTGFFVGAGDGSDVGAAVGVPVGSPKGLSSVM